MKYMIACDECGSVNLTKSEGILSEGDTVEVIFKCNDCFNIMGIYDISFDIWY